ncbi:YaeQ family protein [Shewanella sp. WXL01]|uniref:YaeQ family protein n=1 Tax=Shewanella maritima TaxID=2520507 RepID=A0A411PKN6_9GAMM|nr:MULTISPECIES: YaeQ family protein [Shewanella]NKF51129.1 YaeQ family protein [Shewanella sp. WXL01]QBF84083.1 YaeQ family protein [Shewanella maritima]
MALKSTVFKVSLQIADMVRHYYCDHSLTLAQHPSETDERMMVRLLAFALNASETLSFSKGLCVDDEAELWDVSLSGEVDLWVAFGQSDEKWLRKAAGRAKSVVLYTYGGRSVPVWWQQNQAALARYQNLKVYNIPEDAVTAMAQFVDRNIELSVTITEDEILLANAEHSLSVELEVLKAE